MRSKLVLTAVVLAVVAATASGSPIGAGGDITDWGITPFSQANQNNVQAGNLVSTIGNDYSPIDYPGGIGHVPSYGTAGERFDLEEMHVQFTETDIGVLVVTSSAFSTAASGTTWHLGDLFITVDDSRYGVVTQAANQGLTAGEVYRIDADGDVVLLQSGSGGYLSRNTLVANDYGPPDVIRNIAGPWAVDGDADAEQRLGNAAMDGGTHDYGGDEDGTFVLEYRIDRSLLGAQAGSDVGAHITWGCGNDVIRTEGTVPTPIPEPATACLLMVGLTLCVFKSRHVRRWRVSRL